MFNYKPDLFIETFDKSANEPIQNLIGEYLKGDEKAGWIIEARLKSWLTPADQAYLVGFVAQQEEKVSAAEIKCLLGHIYTNGVGAIGRDRRKADGYLSQGISKECALAYIGWEGILAEEFVENNYHFALTLIPNYPPALEALARKKARANPAEAFKSVKIAADQGYSSALSELAYYRGEGIGCSKKPKIEFDLYQQAATKGWPIALGSLGRFYSDPRGFGVVKPDINQAAYLYRVAANPSCRVGSAPFTQDFKNLIQQNPNNLLVQYHYIIFSQDETQLRQFFQEHPAEFVEYFVQYDLHRLQYEPWLKAQISKLAGEPVLHAQQDGSEHCLFCLCLFTPLTSIFVADPDLRNVSFQAAAHFFNQITAIADVTSPFAFILFQTWLLVNFELAKINSNSEEKNVSVELQPKLALFINAKHEFLVDETKGLPALLKSPNLDDNSRAVLDSYMPHTRHKAIATKDKTEAKAQSADLFDLQYYLQHDAKWRIDGRKELRKVTYGLILFTLDDALTTSVDQSDEKADTGSSEKTDLKQRLTSILDQALVKEKTFIQYSSHEFADILRGIQTNLDHVIYEYETFSRLFANDLQAAKEANEQAKPKSVYSITLGFLQKPVAIASETQNSSADPSPGSDEERLRKLFIFS